jgi:Arc/MetJ family transcription regulator
VREQYALLRDVDFEEDQYEKSKMEERRKALTKKIKDMITKFPNDILENVDFEEDQYEKSKMEERRKALTKKIKDMITKFPNDILERKLGQLDAAIIEETERIYNLSVHKSALHFMQEENLAKTIETQNLEILRLERELAAKESSWWNPWKKWRHPTKTVDIDELLCRIQQL